MHVGSPRTEWAELPDLVRAEIEGILGDRVVRATTQAGGFSPGVAAVVELASGDRRGPSLGGKWGGRPPAGAGGVG